MKKVLIGFFTVCTFVTVAVAQNDVAGRPLPAIDVKGMDGKTMNTSKLVNDGKPMIISFWATWCKPCKQELDAIAEHYEDWQDETGVKLIAVSTDDSRSSGKVSSEVKTKGWDYEIYLDENGDFKRAMNVNIIPHTFIINGKGEIVWQHNSYAVGDEQHLYEAVKKIAKGEKP